MWNLGIKKTLYTLNLNPDEYKEITDITYPLLKQYAMKIGAEFYVISTRKFPQFKSPTVEKCQVYELAQIHDNDWNLFIDCDALIHPDTPDLTVLVGKDTVVHNGCDFAPLRWKYDRFFLRDGRHIGSATWLCMASDWCIELFKPPDDLTPDEVDASIFPIVGEIQSGIQPWRLIEDYVFSRNIAKYGLKFIGVKDLMVQHERFKGNFMWHNYAIPVEQKIVQIKQVLKEWKLDA